MHICPSCGAKMPPRDQRAVFVASDAKLRNPLYLKSLKAAMGMLKLPRRQWRDAIADALCAFKGELLYPGGEPYLPPEIDDVFPEGEDQRWVSDFGKPLEPDKTVRLRASVVERVRLIDLFFRLRYPQIAQSFGQFDPANDNDAGQP